MLDQLEQSVRLSRTGNCAKEAEQAKMNNSNAPDSEPRMTLLERREIEASIVGPLMRAFSARFGEVESLEVLEGVISELAHNSGTQLAKCLGTDSLEGFATTLDQWKAGGALELQILEQSEEKLSFNVTRCRYAEMYRLLGLQDLGQTLSCLRDFELAKGFNDEMNLKRTQTIMEGADHCDFRFVLRQNGHSTDDQRSTQETLDETSHS